MLLQGSSVGVWIGLRDEDTMKWTNGKPVIYTNWSPVEPKSPLTVSLGEYSGLPHSSNKLIAFKVSNPPAALRSKRPTRPQFRLKLDARCPCNCVPGFVLPCVLPPSRMSGSAESLMNLFAPFCPTITTSILRGSGTTRSAARASTASFVRNLKVPLQLHPGVVAAFHLSTASLK